jgi:hypothetical protein
MRKLASSLDPLVGFYRGINMKPRAFVCLFLAVCDRIIFCLPSSAILRCHRHPFLSATAFQFLCQWRERARSPHEGMDPFLGDGKEVVGACGQWSPAVEDEPGSAGVEGAIDQSPGAVATRGLRGELRRLP